MISTEPLRSLMLTAILAVAIVSPVANAERDKQAGAKRGPPPQAIESCSEKEKGEACSFAGRRDEQVLGTCMPPRRNEDGALVCAPEDRLPKEQFEQ